jgi:hypothetical protein
LNYRPILRRKFSERTAAAQAARGGAGKLISESADGTRAKLILASLGAVASALDFGLEAKAAGELATTATQLSAAGVQLSQPQWKGALEAARQGGANLKNFLTTTLKNAPAGMRNRLEKMLLSVVRRADDTLPPTTGGAVVINGDGTAAMGRGNWADKVREDLANIRQNLESRANARGSGSTQPPQPQASPAPQGSKPKPKPKPQEQTPNAPELPEFSDAKLGKPLGSGGNKNVFQVPGRDDLAIAILKPGKPVSSLNEEIQLLNQLKEQGLPTLEIMGRTTHGGQPALLMRRYEQGSKDIVRLVDGKIRTVGQSKLLNEKSIADLQRIRSLLEQKKIKVDDLQFLIGKDGSVVIADPLGVFPNTKPSPNNLRMIDLLIQSAQKNIDSR